MVEFIAIISKNNFYTEKVKKYLKDCCKRKKGPNAPSFNYDQCPFT